MKEALLQARLALEAGETPIGAVVTSNKQIIAKAYNQTEKLNDSTAHAEMVALTAAFGAVGAKYLKNCSLYVTLEPCLMCAGALRWSQIKEIFYGANDPHKGYARIQEIMPKNMGSIMHPRTKISSGLLASDCKSLIDTFFEQIRNKQR